jgi:TusA-related sulfurtransferase
MFPHFYRSGSKTRTLHKRREGCGTRKFRPPFGALKSDVLADRSQPRVIRVTAKYARAAYKNGFEILRAMMPDNKTLESGFPILPSTKIAALLDHFPELEDVLIGLAPPFQKLKNPILRKSVARVASLRQAAAVGRMDVLDLVNRLRAAVGQESLSAGAAATETSSYFPPRPEWFSASRIVASIDEKASDPDRMPVVTLLQRAAKLQPGEMLELVTTFLPAPGIDILKSKGLQVWSMEDDARLIRTYVSRF